VFCSDLVVFRIIDTDAKKPEDWYVRCLTVLIITKCSCLLYLFIKVDHVKYLLLYFSRYPSASKFQLTKHCLSFLSQCKKRVHLHFSPSASTDKLVKGKKYFFSAALYYHSKQALIDHFGNGCFENHLYAMLNRLK